MNVNAIGGGYQNQAKLSPPTIEEEQGNSTDAAQISKLNAEIKEAEAVIKETMKEAQKAASESMGGPSDKAQMLQSKILMQQQAIMMKQMQVEKIESPKGSDKQQLPSAADAAPRFDRYVAGPEDDIAPDNVYRMEENDGVRQIVFNRPEE